MTKQTYLIALALAGMTGTLNAADLAQIKESGTIRIAVANEIPYGYMDMNGKAAGAGPDVAKLIAAKLGVKQIEWITTNFSSLIPGLQADRFDMVAAEMAILPDRCKQVLFSEPNTSYGEGLLVASGNPKNIHAYGDFAKNKDLKVAIMSGADQLEMMQALGVPQSNMVMIASNADAISTVSTGRADAYAATGLTASGLAGQSDKVELAAEFTDPVVNGTEIRSWGGFAFASGNDELRDAVNAALAEIRKSPQWAETLTGYGFTDADIKGAGAIDTAGLCDA